MKFIISLFIILFTIPSYAANQWCQWDGNQGTNCQSDTRGYIDISGMPVKTPTVAHGLGWYRLVVTQPTIGENQVIGTPVWGFSDNVISKTWTVRDMTDEEIDQRDAQAMDITMYYLIKGLISKGVFTLQEAATFFPAESITAYQARKRLEQ